VKDLAGPARQLLTQALHEGRRVAVRLKGASLEPLLCSGDVVLLEAAEPRLLGPGDLVVFEGEEGLIAHRLLRTARGKRDVWVQTAAERAQHPDPWVRRSAIIGRVAGIRPDASTGPRRRLPGRWGRRFWAWRTRIRCLVHRARACLDRCACR